MNQGRLVEQDELAALRAPTGRSIVRTPDVDQARELLDGRVAHREVDKLLVSGSDTAMLNAQLVAGGVRVTEISAERRSLEDVVLAVTSSGSDRVDSPVRSGPPDAGSAPGTGAAPGPGDNSDVLEQGNVAGREQA